MRGQVTVATHRDLLGVDERNAIIFRENRDRPLELVIAESRQVYDRLLLVIKLVPEDDLISPHRFERYIVPFWDRDQPLWKCIAGDSFEHYAEHIPSIDAWLARQDDGRLSAAHSIAALK